MLICCPECGLQVSDKAQCCPHCGYSLEAARNERAAEKAAIVAQENQATYDATFRPNEIYLASPMPFKALFRAFTIKGRASRAEFWSFFLLYVLSVVILALLCNHTNNNVCLFVLFLVFLFYGFFALFTAFIRRYQDVGDTAQFSGCIFVFAFICLLIPIIGWFVFVICLLVCFSPLLEPSSPQSNKHGPPPDSWYKLPVPLNSFTTAEQPCSNLGSEQEVQHDCEVINVNCPYCGENCELPNTVVDGQHVICPYCEQKFSYSAN